MSYVSIYPSPSPSPSPSPCLPPLTRFPLFGTHPSLTHPTLHCVWVLNVSSGVFLGELLLNMYANFFWDFIADGTQQLNKRGSQGREVRRDSGWCILPVFASHEHLQAEIILSHSRARVEDRLVSLRLYCGVYISLHDLCQQFAGTHTDTV